MTLWPYVYLQLVSASNVVAEEGMHKRTHLIDSLHNVESVYHVNSEYSPIKCIALNKILVNHKKEKSIEALPTVKKMLQNVLKNIYLLLFPKIASLYLSLRVIINVNGEPKLIKYVKKLQDKQREKNITSTYYKKQEGYYVKHI